MNILKRPPGDEFTFRLFFQLVNKIKQPKDVFYLWSTCIDPNFNKISHFIGTQQFYENEIVYRNVIESNVKNNLIVLGIKDHLTSKGFNPQVDQYTDMMIWLKQMAQYYPDKQIVLYTSLENLVLDEPNISIIPWGGDITNHQREYSKLEPIIDKNYDSRYTFLNLNRHPRHHRVMLINLLHISGLTPYGMISCMFKDLVKGFEPTINDSYNIYDNNPNDNVNNFKNKLASYYKNTFIEIVSETSYMESAFNLTEKTLNSIYGCNFPIFISSAGTVQFLRDIGMDVFDDIIDHSYDEIEDPYDRMHQAISLNYNLLTGSQRIKYLHITNKQRFLNNVDFAKNKLYNFYKTRAEKMTNELNL